MSKYFLFSLPSQLISPFPRKSIAPQNTDENSFKHFIEHLVGVKENPKFQA